MSPYTKEQLSLVSTSTLPTEVSEVLRAAAIERMKEVSKLRQYGFVDTSPSEGAQSYIYHVLDELSAAKEVAEGAEPDYEDANSTKGSKPFMKIMKAFKISWEADALKEVNLRAGQTKACVDWVFEYEDSKIVTRLETDTGQTTAASNAWSTSSADPVANVRAALRKGRLVGYTHDKILIDPTAYEDLISIAASNNWYNITEAALKADANTHPRIMGLDWIENSNCTDSTATLFKSGITGAFVTAEAKKLGMNIFDDNDAQTTKVQVYERVVPAAVWRTDAVCTITSI